MSQLTTHGQRQRDRLAMHVGLMVHLLQRGAPLVLVQAQAVSLRTMLKEIVDLEDESPDAWMQVTTLLSDEIASAIAEGMGEAPSDISSLVEEDPGEDP